MLYVMHSACSFRAENRWVIELIVCSINAHQSLVKIIVDDRNINRARIRWFRKNLIRFFILKYSTFKVDNNRGGKSL